MNRRGPGMRGRARLFTWLVALAIGGAMTPTGCTVDRDDRYELLRRAENRATGEPTPLRYAGDDDAGAARVRRLMSDEMSGELLRTFAMARRLVSETAPRSSPRRAHAALPAYVALGPDDLDRGLPYRDRELRAAWWKRSIPGEAPIVWIEDQPERSEMGRALASVQPKTGAGSSGEALRDAVVLDQLVGGFARAIIGLVAPSPVDLAEGLRPVDDPLVRGYETFLQVVAAEWRARAGDQVLTDARAVLQRAPRFADVRGDTRVVIARDVPRREHIYFGESARAPEVTGGDLLRDPLVIAAFLYRLAASDTGRRLAPDETYFAMVPERPPAGISAGHLLGAFRNFQAKLLWAWNRAALVGRAPHDLVDLVEAYAQAFEAERAAAIRIFLVTTAGLTVEPGGISEQTSPEEAASRFAALTTDVLVGRRNLKPARR